MFETPILFIVFNRPSKTRRVFERIRLIQPKKFYIAADGPRKTHQQDAALCREVKELIKIDWECTIAYKYRDQNAGCKTNVSEAINWFFSKEEAGIILEDDCLPDLTFFPYCTDLLQRYKSDNQIFSISGCNFGYTNANSSDYFLTPIFNMWGWATWKRSAKLVDYNLREWDKLTYMQKLYFAVNKLGRPFYLNFDWGWFQFWINIFNKIATGDINTWDYQWAYAQLKEGALTIFPKENLIENIGFDADATHTKADLNVQKFEIRSMAIPLAHSFVPKTDYNFYDYFLKRKWAYYQRRPLSFHLKNYLLNIAGRYR